MSLTLGVLNLLLDATVALLSGAIRLSLWLLMLIPIVLGGSLALISGMTGGDRD